MIIAADDLKKRVTEFVDKNPGCTAIEMIVGMKFGGDFAVDMPIMIERLVNDGSLIEVEYVQSNMDYRTKSLLFPKGKEVVITKTDTGVNVGGKELPRCKSIR